MILKIMGLLLLTSPYIWEVINDKDGDAHISRGPIKILSKKVDVYARIAIAAFASSINWFWNGTNFGASLFLSGAFHFLFFDYTIAYVLIQKRIVDWRYNHWFSFMGTKSKTDEVMVKMDPVSRLILRLLIFALAVTVYVFIKR
jgi:hypothetical protein